MFNKPDTNHLPVRLREYRLSPHQQPHHTPRREIAPGPTRRLPMQGDAMSRHMQVRRYVMAGMTA